MSGYLLILPNFPHFHFPRSSWSELVCRILRFRRSGEKLEGVFSLRQVTWRSGRDKEHDKCSKGNNTAGT